MITAKNEVCIGLQHEDHYLVGGMNLSSLLGDFSWWRGERSKFSGPPIPLVGKTLVFLNIFLYNLTP